jgi:hypothetical protein
MRDIVDGLLLIPVSWRAVLFFGALFFTWLIFGRLILKLLSIVLWLFQKVFIGLYQLLEIPISALHRKFGTSFEIIDQGLTTFAEKVCAFTEMIYGKMKKPESILGGKLFGIYILMCAYFLVPLWANLTEKPFTFWQKAYVKNEASVVSLMERKGWIDGKPEIPVSDPPKIIEQQIQYTTETAVLFEIVEDGSLMSFNYNNSNGTVSFTIYENEFLLSNGNRYAFHVAGEVVFVEKQLGNVYFCTLRSTRAFSEKNNMTITFNPNSWVFSSETVTIVENLEDEMKLLNYILPYEYDVQSRVFSKGWHEVNSSQSLLITNGHNDETVSISSSEGMIHINDTLSFPEHHNTTIVCFNNGDLFLWPPYINEAILSEDVATDS